MIYILPLKLHILQNQSGKVGNMLLYKYLKLYGINLHKLKKVRDITLLVFCYFLI